MYVYIYIYILYIYIYCIYIYILYIYILYILKRLYKEIEKSILQKRMMVKKIYENIKSPYISILTCLKMSKK